MIIYLGLSLIFLGLFKVFVKPRKEIIFMSVGIIVFSSIAQQTISYMLKMDEEVISGQVTKKYSKKVPCEHSYSCNCHSVKRGSATTTECSTCYEHLYDVDWVVDSTIGSTTIARVNRQGTSKPKRFDMVTIGEPFASTHSFYNHLKGSENSLFFNKHHNSVVDYPSTIYDYYKIDRVVNEDKTVSKPLQTMFNDELSERLKTIGSKKQVNVVLYFTKKTEQHGQSIKKSWLNGKKNDVVIVIGSTDGQTISWSYVFGWSKQDVLNIAIRNDLLQYNRIDKTVLDLIFENIDKYWVRNEMINYSYLEEENSLDILTIIGIILFNSVGVVVVNYIDQKHRKD